MPNKFVQPPAPVSRTSTTLAFVLGIVSIVALLAFALSVLISDDREDRIISLWLLLPALSFCAGAIAAPLGAMGWADIKKNPVPDGLKQAQWGTILGCVSVGIITLCII